jgi:plastocyanin
MGNGARMVLAGLLAAAIGCFGMLAALAIASPDARITSSHTTTAHHKARRSCTTTRRRKGKRTSQRAVRCPAKHHPAAKHSAGPSAPSPTSTTSTGTVPTTTSTGSGTGTGTAPVSPGEETTTPKPPEVPRVQVTAVEYKYTLSRTTVPAGKIILEFDNKGQDEHNLNVLSGGGELSSSFANEKPGGVTEQAVDLKPGSYMLFCSLPEHEAKGMKATLVVE